MPILTGTIDDVTGSPLPDRVPLATLRVTVRAPSRRSSLTEQARLVASVPVPVEVSPTGEISVELEPGPAVMLVEGEGLRDVYELYVTADMTLLTEAANEAAPAHERSWVESQLVQLRTETENLVSDAVTAAGAATSAAGEAEADRAHVDSIRTLLDEAAQTNVAPYLTETALNATYAQGGTVAPFVPSDRAEITELSNGVRFVDFWGGKMWGFDPATGFLHSSTDEGRTWTLYCNSTPNPGGDRFPIRLVPTSDGEVLLQYTGALYRSSGWANGNAATWTQKLTSTAANSAFLGAGLDGDGTKFIIIEYNFVLATWVDSRYAWISLDAGKTWSIKYDSWQVIGEDNAAISHVHSCCYDPWSGRFYVSEGHGPGGGIYCSTDNGATWSRAEKMGKNIQDPPNGPTVMVATDDGLVCGSDNAFNGLFGVLRRDNPADEVMAPTWELNTGRNGLICFAQRGWRDPDTGLVYVTFRAEFDDTPLVIAAGTAAAAGLVYEHPVLPVKGGGDRFVAVAKVSKDRIVAYMEYQANPYIFRATLGRPTSSVAPLQGGRMFGGTAWSGDSVAVGRSAAKSIRSVTAGAKAGTASEDSVAVGYRATGGGVSTVVGASAKCPGSGVAVGSYADAGTSGNNVAVGTDSVAGAGGGQSVAVGRAALSRAISVAVGDSAKVISGDRAVALGANTTVDHSNAVALGQGTSTTGPDQVNIGSRILELVQHAMPLIPPAGNAQLLNRSRGDGGGQLIVQFRTGSAMVLATENGPAYDPTFTTALRPSAATYGAGARIYDSTLGKPLWSDGSTWRDAIGTAV